MLIQYRCRMILLPRFFDKNPLMGAMPPKAIKTIEEENILRVLPSVQNTGAPFGKDPAQAFNDIMNVF